MTECFKFSIFTIILSPYGFFPMSLMLPNYYICNGIFHMIFSVLYFLYYIFCIIFSVLSFPFIPLLLNRSHNTL